MNFSYAEHHLDAFKRMAKAGQWAAPSPQIWMESANLRPLSEQIGNEKATRSFLKEISSRPDVSDRDVLWAILAWGKMRRDAARRLAKSEDTWIDVVERLRRGDLSRKECYAVCSDIVNNVKSGGIGPAYFTKLIFFACPRHDGYIMDQWTSRSVNLLVDGPKIVRMRTVDHVDPRNTSDNFENFCLVVENLSEQLALENAESAEQCLFSKGGRKPDPWRAYLRTNGG